MLKRHVATHFRAEEYLALEQAAETKHEYYDGKIYDMAGGSPDHNLVSLNVGAVLRQLLEPTPCRVFTSDMRVLVEAEELYTYPDVSVVCGKLQFDPKSKTTITNPIVLVEILSPFTRKDDRGAKFQFYKKIPSLQQVIIIDPDRAHVEVLRRAARGQWTIEMYNRLEASAVIHALDCEIPLAQIYAKVSWLE